MGVAFKRPGGQDAIACSDCQQPDRERIFCYPFPITIGSYRDWQTSEKYPFTVKRASLPTHALGREIANWAESCHDKQMIKKKKERSDY